ncbi:hypothetical protein MHO82_12790 [Vibrio sp. Of7-15]|uniref:hypothetical protein n=1 Tax=Vibrio sp. Of7-15 TaxID=2724879 RepID=UPI001EF25BDB|nr:hypothetical protein [Vibrio sp. Of7-15]MCG7497740.1 hypothetical protein [Vibrio sp. Of7-15]
MIYLQLTKSQRYHISVPFAESYSQEKIADKVGVHRPTISCEPKLLVSQSGIQMANVMNQLRLITMLLKGELKRHGVLHLVV